MTVLPALMRRGNVLLTSAPPSRTVAQWYTMCSLANGLSRLSQGSLGDYHAQVFVEAVVSAASNLPPTALSEGCITEAVSLCRMSDVALPLRQTVASLVQSRVTEFAMSRWPRGQLVVRLHSLARGDCCCTLAESMFHVLRLKLSELDANELSVAVWCAAKLRLWDRPEFQQLLARCQVMMKHMTTKQLATVREALDMVPVAVTGNTFAADRHLSLKSHTNELQTLLALLDRTTSTTATNGETEGVVQRLAEIVQRMTEPPSDWSAQTLVRLRNSLRPLLLSSTSQNSQQTLVMVLEKVDRWMMQRMISFDNNDCLAVIKYASPGRVTPVEAAALRELTGRLVNEISGTGLWDVLQFVSRVTQPLDWQCVVRRIAATVPLEHSAPAERTLHAVLQLLQEQDDFDGKRDLNDRVVRWVKDHTSVSVEVYVSEISSPSLREVALRSLQVRWPQLSTEECWRVYCCSHVDPAARSAVSTRLGKECATAPLDQVLHWLAVESIPQHWLETMCQRLAQEGTSTTTQRQLMIETMSKHLRVVEELYLRSPTTDFLNDLSVTCALQLLDQSHKLTSGSRVGICNRAVQSLIVACNEGNVTALEAVTTLRFMHSTAARNLLHSDFRALLASLQALGSKPKFAASASPREKGLFIVFLQGLLGDGDPINPHLLTSFSSRW